LKKFRQSHSFDRIRKNQITTFTRPKRNNIDYYQNSNLHVILIRFGPLKKKHYELLKEKIARISLLRTRIILIEVSILRAISSLSLSHSLMQIFLSLSQLA